jgi:hypothetical protein
MFSTKAILVLCRSPLARRRFALLARVGQSSSESAILDSVGAAEGFFSLFGTSYQLVYA